MASHNDLGNQGESLAVEYLQAKGYDILNTNWRFKRSEVDIICKAGAILVFVEVKTLTKNDFGFPEQSVTPKKEQMLSAAAEEYIYQHNHNQEIRFDIIAITLEPTLEIKHFEDAFFPNNS